MNSSGGKQHWAGAAIAVLLSTGSFAHAQEASPVQDTTTPGPAQLGAAASNAFDPANLLVIQNFLLGGTPSDTVSDSAGNVATVRQRGTDNRVGVPSEPDHGVVQDGRNNTLFVEQDGHANEVGTSDDFRDEGVTGVSQIGRGNTLVILQGSNSTGPGNTVGAVRQVAEPDVTRGTNTLTILQSPSASGGGSRHFIGLVRQFSIGARAVPTDTNVVAVVQIGGSATAGNALGAVTQEGAGNRIGSVQNGIGNVIASVDQIGDGNTLQLQQDNASAARSAGAGGGAQAGNSIGAAQQIGDGNSAQIAQRGARNALGSVVQQSRFHSSGNTLTLLVRGDDNGTRLFSGAAAAVGVPQGEIAQRGGGNRIDTSIVGDGNAFGFVQAGEQNAITSVVGSGDDNQAAVLQKGDGNVTHAVQTGSRNVLGVAITGDANGADPFPAAVRVASLGNGDVTQNGNGNSAGITITGDHNGFALRQSGNGNDFTAAVTGNRNQSAVAMTGSRNKMDLQQDGSNNVFVGILQGNGNGTGVLPADALAIPIPAGLPALRAGAVSQFGNANSVILNVSGDSNAFGMVQAGNGNAIAGAIVGMSNAVAVVQTGSNNTASFSQMGSHNQLTINQ